jgi:NADH-quinone oxidoreductase subunit E
MVATTDRADRIIDKYVNEEGILIQVLLDMQHELNWLPPEVLQEISVRLAIPMSQILRVASFYKAFSLTPRGRHVLSICLGTACHVRGAPRVLDKVEQVLKVKSGETTPDQRFTVETVNCLGCCALGPVMTVDGKYHGKLQLAEVEKILQSYE